MPCFPLLHPACPVYARMPATTLLLPACHATPANVLYSCYAPQCHATPCSALLHPATSCYNPATTSNAPIQNERACQAPNSPRRGLPEVAVRNACLSAFMKVIKQKNKPSCTECSWASTCSAGYNLTGKLQQGSI
ncbi:hypothetical protein FQN60_006704 [Etheostoma spectabile]|uniref:Uncharacterized protein n=1 Tax=Etheostoma spectabile TaxID=54343 RepID=A0A5J5CH64_9PERO|nr:hypothetical protein FQN60_006704 [Etheostoma spectabile]